jgi:hypothetical protein
LSVRNSSHQIEQKNEQVIGVTGGRRQRFFVSNFKINQPRAIRFLAVDHMVIEAWPCDQPLPNSLLLN